MNQEVTLRNGTNSIEMDRNSSAFKEVANGNDLSQPGRKMLIQVDLQMMNPHRGLDIVNDDSSEGSVAFAVFWVLAVFPAVPFLPIGRTAGSLLGAMLMVVFRILTPNQVYAAIDLSILGLLFGTMVVSVYLERADMFKYLGKLLSWKCQGTKDLLCRICFISAISSSLFTNDTSCIVLTEFVLKIARQNQVPLHPFLLALASSANIGSSATPIGNPQNLVIAIQSGISFGEFVVGVIPAMLVGAMLVGVCFECFNTSGYVLEVTAALVLVVLDFKDAQPCLENASYSLLVFFCGFCGMFITVKGFNRTGIPSTFWNLMEPHARINHVSGIAVLALVVLVLSNVSSNVPTGLSYKSISAICERFDQIFKIAISPGFALAAGTRTPVSVYLSSSFIPPVLLLGARVAASAAAISPIAEKKAWLILAWVSTVAGNLSLLGSAANLIVCEQACRAQFGGYTLTFWRHLKFGAILLLARKGARTTTRKYVESTVGPTTPSP
ncbi:hypothetical protein RHMOL_Rhmol02G0292200 [Rhododendron molle]|uniref:Uncharacterized protein n=1 Tax=Rhododendron molle TaxID=49168 RepID=A0ACC0PWV7_RHOML|nr:hypothetical protein RHMOL_Rhmol02G0292200 [Rhododendron molle]